MRLMIDENMSEVIVTLLRDNGHDVIAIAEDAPQLPDPDVMAWAAQDDRILATHDTDFGELIYRQAHPAPPAVILFRLAGMHPSEIIRLVTHTLLEERDWTGYLWTISETNTRWRPLPPQPPHNAGW